MYFENLLIFIFIIFVVIVSTSWLFLSLDFCGCLSYLLENNYSLFQLIIIEANNSVSYLGQRQKLNSEDQMHWDSK